MPQNKTIKAPVRRRTIKAPVRRSDVHHAYHDFVAQFKKEVKTGKKHKLMGIWFSSSKFVWKWTGYELMKRVDKWAKKFKKYVIVVPCDDTAYSSSSMVLVQHRSKSDRYHGTTIIFIPQNDGDPKEIFLYPDHHRKFKKALANIKLPRNV